MCFFHLTDHSIYTSQPFVVTATAVDWDLSLLVQGYGAEAAFNGDYFWWTWGVCISKETSIRVAWWMMSCTVVLTLFFSLALLCDPLLQTSVAYFLVDLIWVSFAPHCVKSPGTIVKVG